MADRDELGVDLVEERAKHIRETVEFIQHLIGGDPDKAKASAVSIVISMSKGLVPHVSWEIGVNDRRH